MAGDVATSKERLLSRRREGEAAGPAVQTESGRSPIFELLIDYHLEIVDCKLKHRGVAQPG